MATIVTRAAKGSPLTHNEVDANFTNLNTDKAETSALAAVATTGAYSDLTGKPTLGTAAATDATAYATAAQGSLADSALQGNQTITLSGDATGSGTTSIVVTVIDDSHNHIISNVDGLQTALDAKQPTGAYLTGNQTITLSGDLSGSGTTSINAQIAANVVSANELNVVGNGTATQFLRSDADGSFTWAVPTDTNTTYTAGTGLALTGTVFSNTITNNNQLTNGSAYITSSASISGNAATATTAAACTGNALTATTLQTARTIGGVSFDGSINVNLPGVNATGNQNTSGSAASCTGNAATATVLQTARTINGVSFNGSANITVADTTKLPLAGGAMTGPITTNSTFDGRDVSVDGAKLDGIAAGANNYSFPYTVSNAEGASTVAQRNPSGYLHASYFNGTGSFATSGSSSGMATFTGGNGSDTYARPFSAAAARTLLNVADGANNITNTNQLTNGAGYTTYTSNQATNTSSSVTFNVVTATTFNTTSDIRLKDNIRTFESAMDVVSQLRGVRFAWKETGVETVGLIAQEVEKVLPELIGTNADTGLKSVSYANMVAVLIEAVKELKAEIEELKKR